MKLRDQARAKSGSKAGAKRSVLASSAAPKRISPSKKSAPKKSAAPKKGASPKKSAAKKAAPVKKPAAAPKLTPAPAAPRLATPPSPSGQPVKPASLAAKPNNAPRPAAGGQSAEDRRRAATRKFFARLRSLEAIVGADLRKRGSVVLMQAVDQWYSEAINANATDVSITTAAKAVIAQL